LAICKSTSIRRRSL